LARYIAVVACRYAPGVDSADIVDGFGEIFARYEIPIGLMSKLQVCARAVGERVCAV
jgi:hypothetical protein